MAKLLLFKHICKNRCTFVSDLLQIEFYLRFYYENMYQPLRLLLTALLVAVMLSCAEKKKEPLVTPWGEVQTDTILPNDNFTVSDIVGNGELIALTLTVAIEEINRGLITYTRDPESSRSVCGSRV